MYTLIHHTIASALPLWGLRGIAFIDWQPSVEAFSIGAFSVRWYSLLWCIGLLLAYLVAQRIFKQMKVADEKFEPMFFYCFIGILIGARLGHCIFYEPSYYLTSGKGFIEMLIPFHQMADGSWKFTGYEGLASHGGTIGLIIAMVLYWKKVQLSPWFVLDVLALATPIAACCIRLGNLMNSEIIGNVTDVPWAFIFHSHDALVDGATVPRHPAQLYEAIAYLVFFVAGAMIYWRWYKGKGADEKSPTAVGTGFYFGFCLATIFTFRFFIEFLKKEQVDFEQGMLLDMGQLLSIPFVILGVWCMIRAKKKAAS
ncbi:MAG: prolipoprotein diacylglyceryl transferase [Bacteroidaceae bacterium]|nr:prolipoprotein diacylglyceryl transferase [Bacteroidaceae bacterium]